MQKRIIFNIMLFIWYTQLRGSDASRYVYNLRDTRHFVGGSCTGFNQALIGQDLGSSQTTGIIDCAQRCLAMNPCSAINFDFESRWCELHKWQSKESINSVVYKRGSVFVLLL